METPIDPTSAPAPRRSIEHWMVLGIATLAVVALVALGVFVEPDPRGFGTHEKLGLPPCWPMQWWNVPCPGCGVTTSVALAAHFHVWASIRNQPFGFLCALLVPAFFVWTLVQHVKGRDASVVLTNLRPGKWGIALTVVLVVSWAYKLALVRHWIG